MKITLGEIYKMTRNMTDQQKLKFFYQHFPETQAQTLAAILIIQPKIRRTK